MTKAKRLGWDETDSVTKYDILDPYDYEDDNLDGELFVIQADGPFIPEHTTYIINGQVVDPKTIDPHELLIALEALAEERHLMGHHNQKDHAGKRNSVKHPSDEETAGLTEKARAGGFTYSVANGSSPTTGFALSPYPERSGVVETKDFGSHDLKSYVDSNRDLLDQPDHYVGAWREQAEGIDKVWLDVSIVKADRVSAEAIGKQHNQVAMYDLGAGEEISLGGTGAAN